MEHYTEAADQFAEAIGSTAVHPGAIPLLICLSNSKRFREALDWVRKIRDTRYHIPRVVLDVEIQIYEYVGDVPSAMSVLEELCSRNDVNPTDNVRLALAQFRNGEQAAAVKTIRRVGNTDLRHDPRFLLKLAQMKWIFGVSGSLEDAYQARRYGMDDPVVQLSYFHMLQSHERKVTEPETVGVGWRRTVAKQGGKVLVAHSRCW